MPGITTDPMRTRPPLRFPLCAALLALTAGASGTEPARALIEAVAEAPALAAAAKRLDAAKQRVATAGVLPDPEVEGMASRMVGPMDERSKMYELNLRQPLPKRGELAARRGLAQAGAAMAAADYAVMAGEMAADTAMALAEAENGQARIRLRETQIGRLDAVLRSIEARLATASESRLADRLTVETRRAAMQLMVEEDRRMVADALSEARGRLGLQPHMPLPDYAAPVAGDIDPAAAAVVRLAAARGEEADAMLKMARATANPMTAVGVRYERERTAMGNEDTLGLAFMSELPWRSRRVSRAEAKAAEADRAAAQADASAASYRIASALTRVERAEKLAEISRRLSAETLTRLNAEYDALIRAASAGRPGESTVLQTVELLEKATETELQVLQAELAVRLARAELWRYLPADRFSPPSS